MGTFNLGNVVGIIHAELAPAKTNVLWGKILNPLFPLIVEIYYWDDLASAWVPVTDPTTNYWLRPVIDNTIGTPPVSPTEGDRYLIPSSGTTGAWIGNENKVVEYKSAAWQYVVPLDGFIVTVRTEANKLYDFQGVWGTGGTWNVNDFQVPIAPGTYIPTTEKGLALGVAELDSSTELDNAYIKEDLITYNPATPANWPGGTDTVKAALDYIITAVGASLPDAPSNTLIHGRQDGAWVVIPGVAAAGASTEIQYNTANTFDSSANFTWSDADNFLNAGPLNTHTATPSKTIIVGEDILTIGAGVGNIKWSAIFGDIFRFDNAGTIRTLNNALIAGTGNIARIANSSQGIFSSFMWGESNLIEPAAGGDYTYSSVGGGFNISRASYQNITGQNVDALGVGAFVHGQGDAGKKLLADGIWSTNISRNTNTQTIGHGANANDSFIIGGYNHNIPSDSPGSGILGGNSIKALAAITDTIYVPHLRIGQGTGAAVVQNDAETKIAVIDSTTGQIKYRDANTIGSVSPLSTKGDIYVYSTADIRLGVGTDGQVLSSDSAEVMGLKWISIPGGGDMVLAASQVVTALKTFQDTTFALRNVASSSSATFTNTITADRVYTLPDKDGIIALEPYIISYAVMTVTNGLTREVGANADVNFTASINNGSDAIDSMVILAPITPVWTTDPEAFIHAGQEKAVRTTIAYTNQVDDLTTVDTDTDNVEYVFPIFYGSSPTILTGVTIYTNLTKLIQTIGNKSIAFSFTNEYAYFCFDANYNDGTIQIKDGNGFDVTSLFTKFAITVDSGTFHNGGGGTDWTKSYDVYRSTDKTDISATYQFLNVTE